jgi:uncharacterized protein
MSAEAAQLSRSAFIADLTPRERSLWRVALTLVAGLVAGFVVGLLIGAIALFVFAAATGGFAQGLAGFPTHLTSLIGGADHDLTSSLVLLVLATATNGPWAATFIALAALIAGRRILRYLTAAPKFRWRLLLAGLVFSFVLIGPFVIAGQLLDPTAPPAPIIALASTWPGRIGYLIASIALLVPAAAAEEVVFRGWLLRQTAALSSNPIFLMVVNGVLFSAVHGEFTPDPFLTRALMGAGFVYMTLRLGGIEFSTGAHAANNILIVLFIQPLSLTPSPSAGVSIDSLTQDAFLVLSYVLMTEVVLRVAPLRRWTGADLAAPHPVAAPATVFS